MDELKFTSNIVYFSIFGFVIPPSPPLPLLPAAAITSIVTPIPIPVTEVNTTTVVNSHHQLNTSYMLNTTSTTTNTRRTLHNVHNISSSKNFYRIIIIKLLCL